jgi:hypothetical protein
MTEIGCELENVFPHKSRNSPPRSSVKFLPVLIKDLGSLVLLSLSDNLFELLQPFYLFFSLYLGRLAQFQRVFFIKKSSCRYLKFDSRDESI